MLNGLLAPWPDLDGVLRRLDAEGSANILGTGLPFFLFRLAGAGRSFFAVMDEDAAQDAAEDVASLARLFEDPGPWSFGLFPEKPPGERNALLLRASEAKGLGWFGTRASLLAPCFSPDAFREACLPVKVGRPLPYSRLLARLSSQGYRRTGLVEESGEFAPRGEVFDVWSPSAERPVRINFADDIVESMHAFDAATQRTSAFLAETVFVPCSDRASSGNVMDVFPGNSVVVLADGAGPSVPTSFSRPTLEVSPQGTDTGVLPPSRFRLKWDLFKKELDSHASAGISRFVFCRNMGEAHRLEDVLDEVHCGKSSRPEIAVAPLSGGFFIPRLGLAAWTFADLTGTDSPPPVRRLPKFRAGHALESLAEMAPGDYAVHEDFGIGRFRGLERVSWKAGGRSRREKEAEFLVLEYRGGDRLLVPVQDFRLVQRYVGAEGRRPSLNSLDGAAWERLKGRVRKEVAELARELLRTAALRETVARPSGGSRAEWIARLEKEFAESFPYEETADQTRAIAAVLADLDSPRLMDHLVCGDVGYGKTEIAMRAAFRVVLESRQAAVLVPTTILAEQHHKSFSQRFAAFPVKIGMLSRFQTPAEQKRILADLSRGAVDIVIGTHRLIQKDVRFKDLGLIVIDEEHRFGVKQKEALKSMRLSADMLTLSATPIPRTLSLAMGGVRNISVVETPPLGRLPIDTHLGLYDEKVLAGAVRRELARGGQVFYVHNRVASIAARKSSLEKLFPGVRIGIAHGQMRADSLEKAMWNFLHGKWDVLLSTTIIESGLDIPNVNTLIVEDSEEFGLAQLYQLRGRVGRQKEKAACLLFFSDWARLAPDARKRLEAIREFSALGSGMKLAVRDLEIRGMGNFLGRQQHGWANAVGLDLYCQMLAEEAEKLKAEKGFAASPARPASLPGPEIEIGVSAFIPDTAVSSPGERIAFYKKLAACASGEDLEALRREFLDRFGPLPEPAGSLFAVMDLKILARECGAALVHETASGIAIGWPESGGRVAVDFARLAREHPETVEILPPDEKRDGRVLKILFKVSVGGDPFESAKKFLQMGSAYAKIHGHA